MLVPTPYLLWKKTTVSQALLVHKIFFRPCRFLSHSDPSGKAGPCEVDNWEVSERLLEWYESLLYPNQEDTKSPEASPLLALPSQLAGVPDTWMAVAEIYAAGLRRPSGFLPVPMSCCCMNCRRHYENLHLQTDQWIVSSGFQSNNGCKICAATRCQQMDVDLEGVHSPRTTTN
jgi:hypothetical protein